MDDVVVVDVMDAVHVRCGAAEVSGNVLGGRRGRVALVAVAVASGPVRPDVLAEQIWGDDPPPTWPAALRGLIRSIRAACADQNVDKWLIETTPAGYRLRADVVVSTDESGRRLEIAERLLAEGRYSAARAESEPLTSLDGSSLLPGEDLDWLGVHRRALDDLRVRALYVSAMASLALEDSGASVASARDAVTAAPLDERTHRLLIATLAAAGDRVGVVEAYETCRSYLADQLGVHPSPQTEDTYLSAISDRGTLSQPVRLPTETTSFHGRDRELEQVTRSLSDPGVVCIAGSGGVGKSRLGLRAAARCGHFDGGRYWVHLSNLRDEDLVASTVAVTLGSLVGTTDPAEAVANFLAPLGRALLVLDGCELVPDGLCTLVGMLRERCPQLTILLTSRVSFSIPGERLHTVHPFPLPKTMTTGVSVANLAVDLLVDRVHSSGGQLVIDESTAPLLNELCRRCGGLPLALELAAAQLATMPVGDLLDQLDDTGDDQLRQVLRQSYALLDQQEAAVFRRLSTLRGPAGLSLIRAVVSNGDVSGIRVVRLLRELVAHGLVSVDTSGPRWLYQQDDDIHGFAWELLSESGEVSDTFSRLADAIREMLPADARESTASFGHEISAIAPAVRSLLSACTAGRFDPSTGLEIAFRLHRYWAATDVAEGRLWLTRLLDGNETSQGAGLAMFAAGYLGYLSGDTEAAMAYLRETVRRTQEVDDFYRVRALTFLAGLTEDHDRGEEALAFMREAVIAAEGLSVDVQVSTAMGIACVLSERGDLAAADYAARAVALCRTENAADSLAPAMATAAVVCWQVGDLEAARSYLVEARPMLSENRRIARVALLTAAAAIAVADGDVAAAVDHARAAEDEATELGVERELPLIRSLLARGLLGSGDIAAAAERAAAGIQACRLLTYWHPLSTCLETGAMILLTAGRDTEAGTLLTHAAALRAHGNRPTPPLLPAPASPSQADSPWSPSDHEHMCDYALAQLEALYRRDSVHAELVAPSHGQRSIVD